MPVAAAGCLALLGGLALGLDATPATQGKAAIVAGFGTLIGCSVLTVAVAGLVVNRTEFWQKVGIRILASWTVAISLLYLAWQLR